MKKTILLLALKLLLIAFCFGGCAHFSGSPGPSKAQQKLSSARASRFQSSALEREAVETSRVEVDKLVPPEREDTLVEIIWEIPEEPVDGYLIHYGVAPHALHKTIRIMVVQLETYDDPRFGKVYRYVLSDAPSNRPVYVALSSIRAQEISEKSPVFKVEPVKKKEPVLGQLPIRSRDSLEFEE